MKITYDKNGFYKDGEKLQIISGSIHYNRVVPEYWEDRLRKLKECGFNTVETYTCWNLHERKEGQFDFSGILDIDRYISIAENLGLMVIVRPGPYICGEWDMGGLPSWLMNIPGMRIRCYHEGFIEKIRNYYNKLFEILRPHFCTNGGGIIAVQVENEYGSFGDDTGYMEAIANIYRDNGVDVMTFTSDGPGYFMLSGGNLPGILPTVNFGSSPADNFDKLRRFAPDAPLMCTEYWNGWFDHWYEEHHTRESGDTAEVFEQMLDMGAAVNLYMFHGGTNFAFYNGANHDGNLQPTVTSYDYNCPVSECGDLTDKYYAIRAVIEKKFGELPPLTVCNSIKKAYGSIGLSERAGMFDQIQELSKPVETAYPMTMEELGTDFGFVLYESIMKGPFEELELSIDGLMDRAQIYMDKEFLGVKENTGKRDDHIELGMDFGEQGVLRVLVENLGRVNYGGHIFDKKGITGGIRIANRYHFGYKMYPVTCDDISMLTYEKYNIEALKAQEGQPYFYKGILKVEEVHDTFVKLEGWKKGNVFVNGFNIGRYWNEAGPQKTLYVPAPLLRKGENEIVVLELEGTERADIEFVDKEQL